jgi:23S rRNA pseudouridine1911/1915/1917 synthase
LSENTLLVEKIIPDKLAGVRIDKVLHEMLPEYSRSRLQNMIKDQKVLVDNKIIGHKFKPIGGEKVLCSVDPLIEEQEIVPQDIPLNVVYEDDDIIIINKPIGMVVHPAAGNWDGTLQNGLLFRYPELNNVPRSGIVHRLDKDTSGLMVVSRNSVSHQYMVKVLSQREVNRHYMTIVDGVPIAGKTIDAPIARDPRNRKKMGVVVNGKYAITHFKVKEKYRQHSLLDVKLETGRTHQIRVHLSHIGYPVIGDLTYGARKKIPPGCEDGLKEAIQVCNRQMLHAYKLSFVHPTKKKLMTWKAPLADDMLKMLNLLDTDYLQRGQLAAKFFKEEDGFDDDYVPPEDGYYEVITLYDFEEE